MTVTAPPPTAREPRHAGLSRLYRRAHAAAAYPARRPNTAPGRQPRPARVVVEEQPADELAGGAQPRQRPARAIQHACLVVDPHAAERDRDPARDAEADEWRRIER